jgi:hypothetical protein
LSKDEKKLSVTGSEDRKEAVLIYEIRQGDRRSFSLLLFTDGVKKENGWE